MKKGISYWSFPGGLEGTKDPFEAITEAKQLQFDSIELATAFAGRFPLESDETFCRRLGGHARGAGIEISSLATALHWDCSLTDPDPAVRRRSIEATRRLLQLGAWLGVDAVLTVPGAVDVFFKPGTPVVPYDVAYDRSLEACREIAPVAERLKVALCLENVWNRFLLSPLEFRDFIDRVGSPWVGAYFDVGNVFLFGYPEHWIAILGRRIRRVHVKEFKRSVGTADGFCDLLEGEIPWPQVIAALRAAGYDGYVTAEMIPHAPGRLEKTSAALDVILGRRPPPGGCA